MVVMAVVVVLAEVVLYYLVSDVQIFHVPDPAVVLTIIVLVTQDADFIVVIVIIAVARGAEVFSSSIDVLSLYERTPLELLVVR